MTDHTAAQILCRELDWNWNDDAQRKVCIEAAEKVAAQVTGAERQPEAMSLADREAQVIRIVLARPKWLEPKAPLPVHSFDFAVDVAREAMRLEREACAMVAEQVGQSYRDGSASNFMAQQVARGIRRRGHA